MTYILLGLMVIVPYLLIALVVVAAVLIVRYFILNRKQIESRSKE